tara:strand:- start:231 stop:650 length:420 start_codon:yes stop_codon:yes gene_type:complete
MRESIRVFKLSNGENILGGVFDNDDLFDFEKPIQISLPLKMIVIPRMTKNGPAESLSLSPWVHPMTEDEYVDINPKNVIMTAEASVGLNRYYIHCIKQFDFKNEPYEELVGPSEVELDEVEVEEALDQLTDPDNPETIH